MLGVYDTTGISNITIVLYTSNIHKTGVGNHLGLRAKHVQPACRWHEETLPGQALKMKSIREVIRAP